jgi:hypothetical protein
LQTTPDRVFWSVGIEAQLREQMGLETNNLIEVFLLCEVAILF